MNALKLGFVAALGLAMLATGAEAADVTQGYDPGAELAGAVRYRNLANQSMGNPKEILVGEPDGSNGVTNAATADFTWGASTTVKFIYNSTTQKLRAEVGSAPVAVETFVADLGDLNYLEITVAKHNHSQSVAFQGVTLGADSLGDFPGSTGTTKWKVTGVDLQNGFTLQGTIALNDLGGGVDANYVQIDVGYVAPPAPSDTAGPVTSGVLVTSANDPGPVLLNGEATVRATVTDAMSNIESAEYSINGGSWTSMDAQDSSFNALSETVVGTFFATDVGLNEVCVRGTDASDNVGGQTCAFFLVSYNFEGFSSPIENALMNVAKAGQAIPVKWRLTDADGVPILYPESFVGLYSYPINCTTFSGVPNDAVEEYTPGSSGLQNLGDGYWQFNWKTPKEYANVPNNCRALYVKFDSTWESPVVKFQFKK